MSTFHKLSIQKINRETAEAVSILFDVPENLKETFAFKAGQYVTLKATINGNEVRRAYSICTSPNNNELKVVVKAVENGLFSTYATTVLKNGDTIEVSIPEGKFVLNAEANKNYIAFAAGSGITPVMAMIKSVLENESSSTFTLVYGNKSTDKTIFKAELDLLADKYSERFNLHYIFSQENLSNALFGRIDKGITNYFVKNIHKNTSFDTAFLCGPEKMITIVSDTLKENGFAENSIYFELFTTTTKENPITFKEGKTELTVFLDDEETVLTMDVKDTILAAALRNHLDAPYSCQGGVCSSCLAKVIEGSAKMVKNSILTDSEVEEGLILTCQAHPTTPKLVIDFDDV